MKKLYTIPPAPFLHFSKLWAILLLFFCSAFSAFAEGNMHMLPIPLEERVKQATLIVEGEVVARTSFWDSGHENIYTSNIIKVYKVFKGELREKQVEVITEGGTVGLSKHVFSSSLKLNSGNQGTFFLQDQQDFKNTPAKGLRTTRAYGSQQGMIAYDIRRNEAADVFNTYNTIESVYNSITSHTKTRVRIISQNNRLQEALQQAQRQQAQLAPAISSFSPSTASAGTKTVITITGSGFGATRGNGSVEFKNADDGGQTFIAPLPTDYVSWSDTQIRVRVPGTSAESSPAGTGVIRVTGNDGTATTSTRELVIPYAYSNLGYDGGETEGGIKFEAGTSQPLLQNKNGAGGYTIQYAPSMQSRDAAVDGFQRAVTSWLCTTGVNWEIGEPVSTETIADDDKNIVAFASSSNLGDRVLASTISRYEGYLCGSSNEVVFFLKEFDMQINDEINWQYGPSPPQNRQYDFETVMLHELGHAHQLGHVIRPQIAVMHYAVEFDREYRLLSEFDIEGGSFIMSRSTVESICGPEIPPMERINATACRIFPNVVGLATAYNATATSVTITWSSTDETSVSAYIIERSANGVDFEEIATVSPTGSNSTYTYVDQSPLPFKSYYRIRVEYTTDLPRFTTRRSVVDPEDLDRVVVAPNPIKTNGRARIIFLTNTATRIEFALYDTSGKLLFERKNTFNATDSEIELDIGNLANGIYFLKWNHRRGSGTEKIIKL